MVLSCTRITLAQYSAVLKTNWQLLTSCRAVGVVKHFMNCPLSSQPRGSPNLGGDRGRLQRGEQLKLGCEIPMHPGKRGYCRPGDTVATFGLTSTATLLESSTETRASSAHAHLK
jgi:hypothetical protein